MWPERSFYRKIFHLLSTSQKRVEYVSKTSWRRVNENILTWWNVLKTSSKCFQDVYVLPRSLEEVLKKFMFSQEVLNMSQRSLQDVLETPWKCLEEVLKTYDQGDYIRFDEDVLKEFSEDVFWSRMTKANSSWSRRLEDVFVRTNVCSVAFLSAFTWGTFCLST